MKKFHTLAGFLLLVGMTAVIAWPIIGVIGVLALGYTALRAIAMVHAMEQFFSGKPLHRPSAPQWHSRAKQPRRRSVRQEQSLPNGRRVLNEISRRGEPR